ncbi:MAG TPA: NERD domain-containing protein [Gammaproteobacteria bacterium]|nr:NERD domain-containing protein [Gammaproteobacteria bacterium]
MDPSAIVLAAIAALAIRRISRSAWAKGHWGEWRVRFSARLRLSGKIYHRLDDVTLRCPDGATQIDHIFISRFGVFVLETKNRRGWIFGKEDQAQWIQSIYGRSYRFQNPLRQNFKHVTAVERALQIPPETIHSVVAFVGNSTFKTRIPANVTSGSRFASYIKTFQRAVFTDDQVRDLLREIAAKRLKRQDILRIMHVRNLHRRGDPNALRHCPRCGSRLVLRAARHGAGSGHQFWACSAYPKCRFTQNIG